MRRVRALVPLWRGLRRGETGEVPDDAVTQLGLQLGLCEDVAEAPPVDAPEPPVEPAAEEAPAAASEPIPPAEPVAEEAPAPKRRKRGER